MSEFRTVGLLVLLLCSAAVGYSSSKPQSFLKMSLSSPKPRGCAATPLQKKKVAVFGSGGYMGATVFGFLQRAAGLYGTGIGGAASPRAICATAAGSEGLNRVLGKTFKLAYAGEQMVRLTDMQDVDAIVQRIDGFDAVIVGTQYQLERRPVTGNTYEKSPNDMTYEFYFDERKMVDPDRAPEDILRFHLNVFRNTIEACKIADVKHVVVVETPGTSDTQTFAKVLDSAGIPFTYIYTRGADWGNCQDYTFEKGVQSFLDIQSSTFADDYMAINGYIAGDWVDSLSGLGGSSAKGSCIYREDIAALAAQSLMSLDWTRSRCLGVSSRGELAKEATPFRPSKPMRSDREWCVGSEILAEKLGAVE